MNLLLKGNRIVTCLIGGIGASAFISTIIKRVNGLSFKQQPIRVKTKSGAIALRAFFIGGSGMLIANMKNGEKKIRGILVYLRNFYRNNASKY